MATAIVNNQNYIIEIRRGQGGLRAQGGQGGDSVVANAQTKLSISINNQWINVLQAISGMPGEGSSLVSNAFNALQIFSGANFLPQIATSHVWRGSNGIEIQLTLRFDAVEDAVKDVVDPVRKLVTFWAPSRGGADSGNMFSFITERLPGGASDAIRNSFLRPPGPTPYEYAMGAAQERLLTVAIGKALIITDLIPTQLQWEFEEKFTKAGVPIGAQVQCGFQSYVTPDQQQILKYFTMGAAGGGQ